MADNRINIVIQATDKASAPIKATGKSLDDLGNSSSEATRKTSAFGITGANALQALKVASAAAATAFVAATGFAIASAADYEQSLNVFQSVSSATAAEMETVAARARELGQDISLPGISAKDAAFAMVELSKAGLSVNDTLKASKGVLSLAKAGQLETAEASTIAANALNAFNLEGGEATRVADLLAAGANASSADVRDMAFSLQMSAAQAAAVKVPVEDLTTAIALMANNGIKGSDAGTSLKTMFMNLIPTTDRAKGSMKELNLDFYDAQGRFVGMRAAVEQLEKGTANLTDEQKALHIENIFGADSSRAVNILMKEGVMGYDKLKTAVTKQGAATQLAAAQNAGFKGALDNLQSSVETVAIDVGSKLLPKLTTLIQQAGPGLTAALSTGGNALVDFTDAFPEMWNQMTNVTGILPGLAAGFVAYQIVANASAVATGALTLAQNALNMALRMNPFALVAGAAIGIVTAYGQVVSSSDSSTGATDRLKFAQDNLRVTTDAAKDAQYRLRDANLAQEGSALAVEGAQLRYNDALAKYGPNSYEARSAAYELKSAQERLRDANAQVEQKAKDAETAQRNLAKAKDTIIAANDAVKDSAYRAAGGFGALAGEMNKAAKAQQSGNSGEAFKQSAKARGYPDSPQVLRTHQAVSRSSENVVLSS